MIISRIDHVSIAVSDMDKALNFFERLLGARPGAGARDDHMKYQWRMFSLGDMSRLELLEATEKGSFLDPFLSDRQGGVHHITLQTPDIRSAKEALDREAIPYFGYNEYKEAYWKELFIHPRHAFGVLIQIAEFNADDWLAPQVRMDPDESFRLTPTDTGCALSLSHPGGGTVTRDLSRKDMARLLAELKAMI
jgi:methylmalonyl-CoA/ethylmalonyl-CoA epimerase